MANILLFIGWHGDWPLGIWPMQEHSFRANVCPDFTCSGCPRQSFLCFDCYGIYEGIGWKVIGWLWCNGWLLTKCGLFFNIVSPAVDPQTSSIGVAALGFPPFPWYEALILILEKVLNYCRPHHRSDILLPSQVFVCFSCWRTENSQMVPNQENMEGYQPIQSRSHAQQPLQPHMPTICAGALSWWNRTPFVSFPSPFKISLLLYSTNFQSCEVLSTVGLSGRRRCS